jgi:ABC-type Fe3+/spermidine/putrescine transport system ATPase subunit
MSDTHTTTEEAADDEGRGRALIVEELTKVYGDGTLAVDDISFTVREGDFCVLIGPSGCGKSTTLHSIIGKVEPTDGRIVLGGDDVTDVPTHERDIGLVFQDFQLFHHLTVEENVRYGLERMGRPTAEIDDKVDDTLALLRLGGIRDRSPAELSAGQQQRVALVRSLVLEPKLLLLDEPLGDLDYKLQKFMEREFLRIHRELDTTFVYVTHDQTQAMRLGDQIIVMNDGKIEQSGSVDEIYNRPATAFVATFVGDTNVFHGTLVDVTEGGSVGTIDTDYGEFSVATDVLRSSPEELRGTDLVFAVRPQQMTLSSAVENTVECTVQDVIYRPGRGTQMILTVAGRDCATRELQLTSSERLSVEQERASLGWEPGDAILLEELSVVEGVDLETDILGE